MGARALIRSQAVHCHVCLPQGDAAVIWADRNVVIRCKAIVSQLLEDTLHQYSVLEGSASQRHLVSSVLIAGYAALSDYHVDDPFMEGKGKVAAFAFAGISLRKGSCVLQHDGALTFIVVAVLDAQQGGYCIEEPSHAGAFDCVYTCLQR